MDQKLIQSKDDDVDNKLSKKVNISAKKINNLLLQNDQQLNNTPLLNKDHKHSKAKVQLEKRIDLLTSITTNSEIDTLSMSSNISKKESKNNQISGNGLQKIAMVETKKSKNKDELKTNVSNIPEIRCDTQEKPNKKFKSTHSGTTKNPKDTPTPESSKLHSDIMGTTQIILSTTHTHNSLDKQTPVRTPKLVSNNESNPSKKKATYIYCTPLESQSDLKNTEPEDSVRNWLMKNKKRSVIDLEKSERDESKEKKKIR